MNNTLKTSEIFKSIQGEGRYQGTPATFVRLSGCTRKCIFGGQGVCDTVYHKDGKNMRFEQLYGIIKNNLAPTLVFTGGEPILQWENLKKFLNKYFPYALGTRIHLESNADLVKTYEQLKEFFEYFNYVCFSPKDEKIAKRIYELIKEYKEKEYCVKNNKFVDIKIVTDGFKLNEKLLSYATMVMPLSTYNFRKDKIIQQTVWNYAIEHSLFYSGRLHVGVWGKRRRV
jgi:organic radical activating enzyme